MNYGKEGSPFAGLLAELLSETAGRECNCPRCQEMRCQESRNRKLKSEQSRAETLKMRGQIRAFAKESLAEMARFPNQLHDLIGAFMAIHKNAASLIDNAGPSQDVGKQMERLARLKFSVMEADAVKAKLIDFIGEERWAEIRKLLDAEPPAAK